jgi:uncharacterized coiled-coil protein SlyX
MRILNRFTRTALAIAIAIPSLAFSGAAIADADIDTLKAELAQQRELLTQQQNQLQRMGEVLQRQTEALSAAEQRAAATPSAPVQAAYTADSTEPAFGSSVGSVASALAKTRVGGYGEIHYNNGTDDGSGSGRDSNGNIHAHRAVIYLGHQFSDTVSFNSEFEFEGSSDSQDIETEVEQLYIDWRVRPNLGLKLGQWLMPVGIINERHEPDTFYGIERNPVETQIIPSTWWEKGVLAQTQLTDDLTLDVALSNGLRGDVANLGSADGLREFRQEFGRASTDNEAYTTRLRFNGISGLELAGTVQYQTDINDSLLGSTPGSAPAVLIEAHADYRKGPYELRALFARWDINNDFAKTIGSDVLQGFYLEPAYRINEQWGVFARYNRWNTAYNDANSKDRVQANAGVNYWIAPNVALKGDVQASNAANGNSDGFNLGLGFSF